MSAKKIRVFKSLSEWREYRSSRIKSGEGATLGFVPTMGALHHGHISLVKKSQAENTQTLVSIFVNPTQFDDKNDLEKYPRILESDLRILEGSGADFLLCPDPEEMYIDGFKFRVEEVELSSILCGVNRPGHFRGMLTVVMKLLQLARADRAYFGEKDYQQYLLVNKMAESFFLDTEIVGCETVRESDGLAMSSRNQRLKAREREKAPLFPKILKSSPSAVEAKRLLTVEGFDVDYVEDHFGRRLGAVRLGDTRLIDNVPL